MTIDEFLFVLINNLPIYFLSLIISCIIFLPLIKKTVRSIIDPLFMAIVGNIFANAIVIFLLFENLIQTIYIIYFILSEVLFWIGFFSLKKTRINKFIIEDNNFCYNLFIIFFVLMIISNILTYMFLGIPIFKESRLETYTSSGGMGILSHINSFSSFYCSIYVFILLEYKKKYLFILTILILLIFSILGGSKGAILLIISGFFFYYYFYKKKHIRSKLLIKYGPIVIIFPIITLLVQNKGNVQSSVADLLIRFMSYGDCYFDAYPYNVIDSVKITKPFTYLLSGIMGPLRIINYDDVETSIGLQIQQILYPSITTITGPNARLPIYGWTLWGWGGLILSYLCGFILGLVVKKLPQTIPRSILTTIIYSYIYTLTIPILTDVSLFVNNLFPLLLFLIILFCCCIMFNKTKFKLKIQSYE